MSGIAPTRAHRATPCPTHASPLATVMARSAAPIVQAPTIIVTSRRSSSWLMCSMSATASGTIASTVTIAAESHDQGRTACRKRPDEERHRGRSRERDRPAAGGSRPARPLPSHQPTSISSATPRASDGNVSRNLVRPSSYIDDDRPLVADALLEVRRLDGRQVEHRLHDQRVAQGRIDRQDRRHRRLETDRLERRRLAGHRVGGRLDLRVHELRQPDELDAAHLRDDHPGADAAATGDAVRADIADDDAPLFVDPEPDPGVVRADRQRAGPQHERHERDADRECDPGAG